MEKLPRNLLARSSGWSQLGWRGERMVEDWAAESAESAKPEAVNGMVVTGMETEKFEPHERGMSCRKKAQETQKGVLSTSR